LIIGDGIASFLGLSAGYLVRFHTPLNQIGISAEASEYGEYLPLIVFGTILFVLTYAYLRVYDGRLLLRPRRSLFLLWKGTLFWLAAFLGTTLVFKFEPAVSRIFAATSCITSLTIVGAWRYAFYRLLHSFNLHDRIVQRVILIGWSDEAARLVEAIQSDRNHPYRILGYVSVHAGTPAADQPSCTCLGTYADLEPLINQLDADIAIVVDLNITSSSVGEIASLCERLYVQFKILPNFFQIFLSHLRLQTVSGVPMMGIEELAITQPLNAFLKRAVDLVGAIVGLMVSGPIIGVLTILIRRESPGPVIYRQTRTGRDGRPFTIYKLRSMRLDAEKANGAQWAVEADPRRLKIGAFMRENNLDELPQFWNVLIGDMSLVGPRPERPELIRRFALEIPHYNPRHEVRPGITGWAQVNGLRGNTSLTDRVKYDLFYIENWTLWFDFQIILLTFFKKQNAY
jgi:exopolysaccharide biosynthesis polyprenyl glycosylphosphotransferase